MRKDLQIGLINKGKRQQAVNEIVTYFKSDRGEEIGIIAAEAILDFFLETAGKTIYNKGVYDAKRLLEQHFDDFAIDLEALMLDDRSVSKNN